MAEAAVAKRLASRAQARASRATLWGADDLLRWGFALGAGLIVIAVSWYICAGDSTFNRQIGPADAAVAGLMLAGLGNATWLLRGRRALGERRRTLLPDLEQAVLVVQRMRPADATERLVAGPGLERFHRAECVLAADRSDWVAMTRQQHEDTGRRPCDVCRP